MGFILKIFLKRIPVEGFKSLTVPALSFILVMLISLMGGVKLLLENERDYTIKNFEVRVEVSDPVTSSTDNLNIENRFIRMFTESETNPNLSNFLKDVELKRSLDIVLPTEGWQTVKIGRLTGITSIEADRNLEPLSGAFIEFFEGYDESIFRTEELVCVVNVEMLSTLNTDAPVMAIMVQSTAVDPMRPYAVFTPIETELAVVGVSYGAGKDVLAPFWTIAKLGTASDNLQTYSDIMSSVIADNNFISEFTAAASGRFARAGDVDTALPLSLTVYDGVYNEVIHRLRQNIQLIDSATPFIYLISVLIGFIASFLLTRRRKPEFAIMRSIGINKKDIFLGALTEQATLCAIGSVIGLLLFRVIFGYSLWSVPAMFTSCYILGSALSAQKAAGTNVLKILGQKE